MANQVLALTKMGSPDFLQLAMIKATFERFDNTYRNNPRFCKTIFDFDDVPGVEGESVYSDKGYLRIRAKNDRFERLVDTDFLDENYDYN